MKIAQIIKENKKIVMYICAFLAYLLLISSLYYKESFFSKNNLSKNSGFVHYEENINNSFWNENVNSGTLTYAQNHICKKIIWENILEFINYLLSWKIFSLFLATCGIITILLFNKINFWIAFFVGLNFSLCGSMVNLIFNSSQEIVFVLPFAVWLIFALIFMNKYSDFLSSCLLFTFLSAILKMGNYNFIFATLIVLIVILIINISYMFFNKKISFKYIFFFFLAIFSSILVAFSEFKNIFLLDNLYDKANFLISLNVKDLLSLIFPTIYKHFPENFSINMLFIGFIPLSFVFLSLIKIKDKLFIKKLWILNIFCLIFPFVGIYFFKSYEISFFKFFNDFSFFYVYSIIFMFILFGLAIKSYLKKREKINNHSFLIILNILLLVIIINYLGFSTKIKFDLLLNNFLFFIIFLIAQIILHICYFKYKNFKYKYVLLLFTFFTLGEFFYFKNYFIYDIRNYEKKSSFKLNEKVNSFFETDNQELFRIYPLESEFFNNRWTIKQESIGGYQEYLLKRYNNIINNCIDTEIRYKVPINWNLINMLNVKYLIRKDNKLKIDNLEYVFYDREENLTIYKNTEFMSRAWFVKNLKYFSKEQDILQEINKIEFDPKETALLEDSEISNIAFPENYSIKLEKQENNYIKYNISTDSKSFLVLSEIYLPVGWEAYLNGEKTKIHVTNYVLRGIFFKEPGNYTLEMKFNQESFFYFEKNFLFIIILMIFLYILGIYLHIKENYSGKVIYVLKKSGL